MDKGNVGFAVGAVVAAVAVGGILYALYPDNFLPNNSLTGTTTSTASAPYSGGNTTSTQGMNSTSSGNTTTAGSGNSQPSGSSGY